MLMLAHSAGHWTVLPLGFAWPQHGLLSFGTLQGFTEQLRSLLQKLLDWLQELNVPVQQAAWDKAVSAMAPNSGIIPELALIKLLHGIQAPVTMLLGGLQWMQAYAQLLSHA